MHSIWILDKILLIFVITTCLKLSSLAAKKNKQADKCNNTATAPNCSLCGKSEYYGASCDILCNCLKDGPCSKVDGACSSGCKQWFTVNPNLPTGNCNASIDLPSQPNASLESVEKFQASFIVNMDKTIPKFLAEFYYYRITCIDEDTGEEANSIKINHNSSVDHVIVTIGGLKMLTKYLTKIVTVREQNGHSEEGKYLALKPSFTTKCNQPTAPVLHSRVWPDQIVYLYWDIKEIQLGCDKASINKMVLYMVGKGQNSQTNQWHSLLIDLNYTVLTRLTPGIYDFMLRVETDQNVDDSPVITVSVPEDQLILLSSVTKTTWLTTIGILIVILFACLVVIVILLVNIQRKKYEWKRTPQLPIDDDDNCDMFEENFTDSNDIQRILPRQNSSNSQHYTELNPETRSNNPESYYTVPLRDFNNGDRNLNNNDFNSSDMNQEQYINRKPHNKTEGSFKTGTSAPLYENVPTSKRDDKKLMKKSSATFGSHNKKVKTQSKKVNNKQNCSTVARPPIATKPNLKLQHQTVT